jgi:hypothetical protein
VVAFSIALLVLTAVAAAAWAANYEPLGPGSFGFGSTRPGVHIFSTTAFGVSGRVMVVPIEPGESFRYRFSMRNDGPVAVTVESIGFPKEDQGGNIVTRFPTRMIPDAWLADDRDGLPHLEPWHPFTLEPDHEAIIEMEATFTHGCIDGTLGWFFEPIRFSVFGLPRQSNFQQDLEIRLRAPGSC